MQIKKKKQTLADIAFALRFYNLTDEEEKPFNALGWSVKNYPLPVRVESVPCERLANGVRTVSIEYYADGSTCTPLSFM
jgi:hypothetical protein